MWPVHRVNFVVKSYVTATGQHSDKISENRKAQVFQFVDMAVLFMNLPVNNASGERSFSKLVLKR